MQMMFLIILSTVLFFACLYLVILVQYKNREMNCLKNKLTEEYYKENYSWNLSNQSRLIELYFNELTEELRNLKDTTISKEKPEEKPK